MDNWNKCSLVGNIFLLPKLSLGGTGNSSVEYSHCYILNTIKCFGKIHVPAFRLVTYQEMLYSLERLKSLDSSSGQFFRRTENKLLDILPDGLRLMDAYRIGRKTFLESFKTLEWDKNRYPDNMAITDVAQRLREDIKDLQDQYEQQNLIRRNTISLTDSGQKKSMGAVVNRDIYSMIPDSSYIVESKDFTTLLVIVPKKLSKIWSETYEHITQHIVPDSSKWLASDDNNDLYNLVIWRKGAEAFKEYMTKYTVVTFRLLQFDPAEFKKIREAEEKSNRDEQQATEMFSSWLCHNFRQIFLLTLYIKLLRIHMESLIRYGIPYRFQIIYLAPEGNKAKQCTKELNKLFEHLEIKIPKSIKKLKILDPRHTPYPFTTMVITYHTDDNEKLRQQFSYD